MGEGDQLVGSGERQERTANRTMTGAAEAAKPGGPKTVAIRMYDNQVVIQRRKEQSVRSTDETRSTQPNSVGVTRATSGTP